MSDYREKIMADSHLLWVIEQLEAPLRNDWAEWRKLDYDEKVEVDAEHLRDLLAAHPLSRLYRDS